MVEGNECSGLCRNALAASPASAAIDDHYGDGEHYYDKENIGSVKLHAFFSSLAQTVADVQLTRSLESTLNLTATERAERLNQALL